MNKIKLAFIYSFYNLDEIGRWIHANWKTVEYKPIFFNLTRRNLFIAKQQQKSKYVSKIDNELLIWFGLTFAESEFKTVKIQKYYSAVATGIYPCKQIELENFHPKSFH